MNVVRHYHDVHLNNVPLLRGLSITNATDQPLREVEVAIRCEPEFADSVRLKFERLDPNETRRIEVLDLKFRHQYLAERNEEELPIHQGFGMLTCSA